MTLVATGLCVWRQWGKVEYRQREGKGKKEVSDGHVSTFLL